MRRPNYYFILAIVTTLLIIAIALTSCSTQKNGCGDYSKWEARTRFKG